MNNVVENVTTYMYQNVHSLHFNFHFNFNVSQFISESPLRLIARIFFAFTFAISHCEYLLTVLYHLTGRGWGIWEEEGTAGCSAMFTLFTRLDLLPVTGNLPIKGALPQVRIHVGFWGRRIQNHSTKPITIVIVLFLLRSLCSFPTDLYHHPMQSFHIIRTYILCSNLGNLAPEFLTSVGS